MNTKLIARDYNLRVTHVTLKNIDRVVKKFDLDKDDLINNAFVISDEDIILGIYSEKELKEAAFFHEIGHTLISEQFEKMVHKDEMLIEFQAWIEGLKVARKYKQHFSNKTFQYILESLNSYYKPALKVYSTKKKK
jgi:HD superfamily phosphohydrolase